MAHTDNRTHEEDPQPERSQHDLAPEKNRPLVIDHIKVLRKTEAGLSPTCPHLDQLLARWLVRAYIRRFGSEAPPHPQN